MQAVMHSVRMSTKMDLNNDFVLRGTPLRHKTPRPAVSELNPNSVRVVPSCASRYSSLCLIRNACIGKMLCLDFQKSKIFYDK